MDERQLLAAPPGKWSSAQILEHLGLAFSGTVKGMQRCLEAGAPLGHRPTLKQRAMAGLVVGVGYFPPRRKSPAMVEPKGTLGGLGSLRFIREQLIAMDALQQQCEKKFGASVYLLDHPVLGPLKTLEWPRFHWVHTRHHMKQVQSRRGL